MWKTVSSQKQKTKLDWKIPKRPQTREKENKQL